jgi:hypothetical protein
VRRQPRGDVRTARPRRGQTFDSWFVLRDLTALDNEPTLRQFCAADSLLDPQMNDPPAPEVSDGERLFNARQGNHPERVKDRDIHDRGPDESLKPNAPGPELPGGAGECRGRFWHTEFLTILLLIAGACWIAAFGLFEIVYGPMLLTQQSHRASGAA